MPRQLGEKNCPLKLLSRYKDKIVPHELRITELDESVRQYLASPESERHTLRHEIFFRLSPFLLKSLGYYCHVSTGCGENCQVADLLSTSYIVFTHLIDKFDFEHDLNFLGYVVIGLSWGIFNSYVKERRYGGHRILFSFEDQDAKMLVHKQQEIEERWMSAIELEELMSILKPATRNLFILHHLFGYSYADLAALQKTKVKTIQKTVERARKKMLAAYAHK
jgi:RNA polymerase sigma factor (sigma-70 family)